LTRVLMSKITNAVTTVTSVNPGMLGPGGLIRGVTVSVARIDLTQVTVTSCLKRITECRSLSTTRSKIQVEREPQGIDLAIWRFARVILMLKVGFDLGMPVYGKCGAKDLCGSAPFLIVAVEVHLAADVG